MCCVISPEISVAKSKPTVCKPPTDRSACSSTGVLDMKLFTAIIESIPDGTWEFVCHPGYNDADLGRIHTRLRESREQELSLLTSTEAKELLRLRGVQLISYHEL